MSGDSTAASDTQRRPRVRRDNRQGEVSGAFFLAARRYARARYPLATLDRITRHLNEEARAALRQPALERWYPESTLASLLQVAYCCLSSSSQHRYRALVYDATLFTMRYNFREVMNLRDLNTCLDRLPYLLGCIEREPARVSISKHAEHALVVVERSLASTDTLYRQLLETMLQALLYATRGSREHLSLEGRTAERLVYRLATSF